MDINFTDCTIGNQTINENGVDLDAIKKLIASECEEDIIIKITSIISQLEESKKKGTLNKNDADKWIERIKNVLSLGENLSAFISLPLWETISKTIKEFFEHLQ